jgi:hypothetical protein
MKERVQKDYFFLEKSDRITKNLNLLPELNKLHQ